MLEVLVPLLFPLMVGPPPDPLVKLMVVFPPASIPRLPLARSDEKALPPTTWYLKTASKVGTGMSLISVNRTVTKQNLIINREAIDDFLFNSTEDLQSFLENNKFLLALYIFAIVNKLFFKQA